MAGVERGEALALEDVTEMSTAMSAGDFGAAAVGIDGAFDCAGDFEIEGGPAAAGVELVRGLVERGVAAAADVGAGLIEFFVVAAEGSFGSLVQDDALFFRSKSVVGHGPGILSVAGDDGLLWLTVRTHQIPDWG